MNLNKSNQVIKKGSPMGYKSLFSTERANRIFSLSSLKSTKTVRSKSQYGMMLRESRKLSLLYGNLSKKYLQKIFKSSGVEPSQKKESIFSILESRLDVILYRASFFDTIPAARQVIITGGIEVNKKKVISPGYIVLPGDVVEVLEKKNCSLSYQKYCISKIRKSIEKPLPLKGSNESKPSLLSLKKLCFQDKPIEILSGERREKKIRSRFQQALLLYCKIKRQETGILIEEITQALNRFQLSGYHSSSEKEDTVLSQFNKENRLNDLTFLENKKAVKYLFKSDFSLNKKGAKKKRDTIERYNFTLSNNFVFSNYKLKLEKQLSSPLLRNDYFYKQKKQLFFKEQIFFESKKTKPLHLEISFRSLSLIFLFPPQRVCFPTFINLSLIYK